MANKSSFKMLLFSKYSDPSKRLLGLIHENNLSEKLNINLVCIDNEIVRKKIESSEIEISVVPCLLVVQDKTQVKKYEGKELNDWISFQFQQQLSPPNMMMQQPPPNMMMQQQPPNMMMQQPPPNMMMQQQPPNMMMQQPPPNMMMQQQPPNMMMQQPPPNMMMQQPPPNMMMQQPLIEENLVEEKTTTPIEQIIEEDEEENELEELSPIAIQEITKKSKKKESKYKVPHDYNEYETKNKKKDQKKLDLLNAAMQMKKSREDEDKSINKNFPNM
jgi:hypothetical protein